jgi:hypothetical protein
MLLLLFLPRFSPECFDLLSNPLFLLLRGKLARGLFGMDFLEHPGYLLSGLFSFHHTHGFKQNTVFGRLRFQVIPFG